MFTKKIILLIMLISAFSISNAKTLKLDSNWKEMEITIDGNDSEWENTKQYYEKENVALGFMNDDKYLYVCLSSTDMRDFGHFIRHGFNVYFDKNGKKKKNFGICILPVRMKNEKPEDRSDAPPEQREHTRFKEENLKEMIVDIGSEVRILRKNKDKEKVCSVEDMIGLDLQTDYIDGRFICEMKIPYVQNAVYTCSIDAEKGAKIGIGFESEVMKTHPRGDSEGQPDGSPPGQGLPGSGRSGGRGGMQRGGNSNESRSIPLTFKVWTVVKLSEGS